MTGGQIASQATDELINVIARSVTTKQSSEYQQLWIASQARNDGRLKTSFPAVWWYTIPIRNDEERPTDDGHAQRHCAERNKQGGYY